MITAKQLAGLGMWEDWQNTVKAALPNFAKNPIYVEQDSVPVERFEALAKKIQTMGEIDPDGKVRDAEFGARVVDTCLGPVTRMWLESNEEIQFIRRNMPGFLEKAEILDIGAGYGRLAATMAQSGFCKPSMCVDAVPISTEISKQYCARFAPSVMVLSLDDLIALYAQFYFQLAINIHSWNECTLDQIENWLCVLDEMKTPYLFTVSHGQINHDPEPSYRSWIPGGQGESFRPLIEKRYKLIAEESLGLSPNPFALWQRK